ncbi:hypothetical protein QQ045_009764 [Rhodiola kirilowii]
MTTSSPSTHIFIILTLLLALLSAAVSETDLYADHCRRIVPDSPVTDFHQSESKFLQLTQGYYSGGDPILNATRFDSTKRVSLTTFGVRNTRDSDVVQFVATLYFRGNRRRIGVQPNGRRRLMKLRIRGPRIPVTGLGGSLVFNLHGFWSARSGEGCAVGSGVSTSEGGNRVTHSVVFRFRYLNSSTIETSMVNGVLESVDSESSPGFFKPIDVIGISEMGYKYTLVENQSKDWVSDGGGVGVALGTENIGGFCSLMSNLLTEFSLVYGSDCVSRNCNPLGANAGSLPGVLSFLKFKCLQSEERVRLLINFYNTSRYEYQSLLPEASLVGEGAWDGKTNQLHVVACRIVNHTDSLVNARVGDCSIRLTLMFPPVLSLRNRSRIVGDIWSTSSVNDSSYFDKVDFLMSWTKSTSRPGLLAGVKYEYSVVDTIKNACLVGKTSKGEARYPNAYSPDMYLSLQIKHKKSEGGRVHGIPLSVGDQLWRRGVVNPMEPSNTSIVNISYAMEFHSQSLKFNNLNMDRIDMSAEGIYDTTTGKLCMIGCFLPKSSDGKLWRNALLDCDIRINIQFPALDSDAKHHVKAKGTIASTRAATDPHYFEPIEVSSRSIYTNVAEESIWRMDIEITLVLVSKTLACVFVGLQLYYTRKWPETPPFISILMLVVLTLGHMIPLLLNFEALFIDRHDKSNVSLDNGGWLAVNEVIVRIVTMVAFLLQFRLLQLTWSCRNTDAKSKRLRDSEKKVIYSTLPVYFGGMLIVWFARKQDAPLQFDTLIPRPLQHYQIHNPKPIHNQLSALWGSITAYGGLVHDGFLLPQILFNMFHNSQEKALGHSFYIGTTFLRVFPHLYDLYRDHKGFDFPTMRILYANHVLDFYSTAWNIIIPCLGLLFAAMVFSQQRFGGRCILPKRFRQTYEYEKVPVANGEQL